MRTLKSFLAKEAEERRYYSFHNGWHNNKDDAAKKHLKEPKKESKESKESKEKSE